MRNSGPLSSSVKVAAWILTAQLLSQAQSLGPKPVRLITSAINENDLVTLTGNTREAVKTAHDLGTVRPALPLEHMFLQLQRSPEQDQALTTLIEQLHDPNSPNYHHWLTAVEFGETFGASEEDIATVTGWLQEHGFTVNSVYPNHLVIDFSGSAGQVAGAFHTQIHNLDVNGKAHLANMSDPQIPAALAPVVKGVVSLSDFMPHAMNKSRTNYTFTSSGSTYYAVTPADLATIYNFNGAFSSGYTGTGQTIVVIEDTNVYSTADWSTFRSTFGLTKYTSGSFTQVHPNGCTNPGVISGNDGEAILDAEYASAAAPNAAIELASCADTSTTFGGLIALQNLINGTNPPAIYSISYGECEAENGATANAAYNNAYSQAVAEGLSIYVAAGDEGAASCDADQSNATHGIGVSAFASTPYNIAVGGTDFADSYYGTNSTYWSSSNSSNYGSAESYIPEIPWNDSCASSLIATVEGYSKTYGSGGFCNSFYGEYYFLTTASGSGGPSGCATGAPSRSGVVGGTCKGYGKPTWQSITGNPSDNVRDIPDVSLFAANGVWGHYYIYCWSDTAAGGTACSGAPSGWSGAGGTSFASPIWAGIQALINQKKGAKQGLPAARLYALAGTANFNDVTLGDMDVNCTGSYNCYRPSGSYGVLSTSNSSYSKAYGAKSGWDFATGIGTPNVATLVNNF
jgi:subtilase family serine protease